MMLGLYRGATALAAPLIQTYLTLRRVRGKEDAERFAERMGRTGVARPEGRLAWLHAASVGESLSMLPLIERLLADRPEMRVLMTTGTVSSARLMADRLPERAFHQYVPVDRVPYVRRFLDHWRPDLVLWAESEFWPNLITETAARGTPMVLVNGRISPASYAGWQWARGLIATLLGKFALSLGQTDIDAERLDKLGARNVKCLGNLKFAVPPLPADAAELATLTAAIGDRPRWLLASTHPGEEDIGAAVHRALEADFGDLLSLIVPRHPKRGEDIAATLRQSGLNVALRSAGEAIGEATQIYVADTLGELGIFFRLADIVFMGKSLVPLGGQNPLEALRLDCAVLHGPHMANFQEMAAEMKAKDAAIEVADAAALAAKIKHLLGDAGECARRAARGREFAGAQGQVMDAVVGEIERLLNGLADKEPSS